MKKYERTEITIAVIVILVIALITVAVNVILDDICSKYRQTQHTYHVSIDDNIPIRDTNKYATTWDGSRIIKIDGKPIENGETILILIN